MDRSAVPEQHITFLQRRGYTFVFIVINRVNYKLYICLAIEHDIKTLSNVLNVGFVTSWVNIKPAGTRLNIFQRYPCANHSTRLISIEVFLVLMWPRNWVTLKEHGL